MFTPEQGAAHFEKISGKPNEPDMSVVQDVVNETPNEIFTTPLDDEEVWRADGGLRRKELACLSHLLVTFPGR